MIKHKCGMSNNCTIPDNHFFTIIIIIIMIIIIINSSPIVIGISPRNFRSFLRKHLWKKTQFFLNVTLFVHYLIYFFVLFSSIYYFFSILCSFPRIDFVILDMCFYLFIIILLIIIIIIVLMFFLLEVLLYQLLMTDFISRGEIIM